jgi:hypothetical protein
MVKNYFTRMDISYDFKAITVPPWEMVFNEIKEDVNDMIILQGEFLKMWRKDGQIADYVLKQSTVQIVPF